LFIGLKNIINFMLFNLRLLPLIILPITLLISSGAADLVIILSVVFFLAYSLNNKDFHWIKDKYFILLLIFYIYLLINFYFSQSREESLGRAFAFIRFPLFVMSVKYFFLKDFSKIQSVIKFWIIIIITVLIDTLIQYHYGKNILGYPALIMGDQMRLSSFLGKEYKIGGYLLVFSFIIFTFFVSQIIFYKKFLVFFFFFFFFNPKLFNWEKNKFFFFFLCFIFFFFFLDF